MTLFDGLLNFKFCLLSCTFVTICWFARLWFDELMSLWVSVQNLPSWEVVSGLICWPDSLVSLVTGWPTGDAVRRLGKRSDRDWGFPDVHAPPRSAFKQLSKFSGIKYMNGN